MLIPKLFNEEGGDGFHDQALVGGNPTGIANLNNVRYTWAVTTYNTMLNNFWRPQKINLTEDKLSVATLTKDEDEALKDTLSFLIFLDNYQVNNLPNIAEYITCPAVKHVLTVQAFQEVIHSETYQYVLEALYPSFERDQIYNRWRDNEALFKRNKALADIAQRFKDSPDDEAFDDVLLANYCLEGIYFYQGFNFFDQLAHRGKLVGTGAEIDYIRVDEKVHMGIFANIIKERGIPVEKIHKAIRSACLNEIEWCINTYGNKIIGITTGSSERYIKWLGNDRCARLGAPPVFDEVENPYTYLESATGVGMKRKNFFESGGVVEYDTADSVPGWDEL